MVTGEVDDVWKYTQSGFVGVCPVRVAAGVQNKILEYMATGLPVVTSSVGLEGLDAVKDQHLLVANHPVEIAEKIIYLYQDATERERLAMNARQLIETRFSWFENLSPLVKVISKSIKLSAENKNRS